MSFTLRLRKLLAFALCISCAIITTGLSQVNNTRVLKDASGGVVSEIIVYSESKESAVTFAAEDLVTVLKTMGVSVSVKPLSRISTTSKITFIVIAENCDDIQSQYATFKGEPVGTVGEQEYALRVTGSERGKGYWAIGGDRIGTMYGGIHLGEIIKGGSLAKITNENKSPYIAKRGLKFNIPLDSRTPSFDDRGAAANTNRDDVWDIAFWKEYFDVLARQRFNVLSLWNRHPFPSLVKVPGYENIALRGVMDEKNKFINDWSITRKIEFWNDVLELAHNRGIEVWFVVWNVELYGIGPNPKAEISGFKGGEGNTKYGITKDKKNRMTVDYIKKSVIEYFKSYPRMAGIGIAAGEKMDHFTKDEKEQWLWDAYGEAVMEVKKLQPDRKIRFVHRDWQTDWDQIESRFGKLPDGFEMECKYSQARLYSATNPSYAANLLKKLPKDMATWWNLRNDDIFIQRWGDPEYVREFILNFPHKNKPCNQSPCLTAGYILGSDRFLWARESMSKHPQTPRQLEIEKHWYSFLLWGRLGYDPHTSKDVLEGLVRYRFQTENQSKIYGSWQNASKIIPMINRFHFWPWDYMWWVEKGIGNLTMGGSVDGFHNINQVIINKTQDVSGYTSIKDYVAGDSTNTRSPRLVADSLETLANTALKGIKEVSDGGNTELRETLGDIKSQAYLGLYWAHRIRGGFELELFRKTYDDARKEPAILHLERAVDAWKKYAHQLGESYKKVTFAGHGEFDWDEMTLSVENDITIARKANWASIFMDQSQFGLLWVNPKSVKTK